MTDNKTAYVGYMNPPRHTRFKKGKSGNPRGRPRKREEPHTVLQRVLDRKISIKDEDRKIPMREALIRKLRELALQGDKQALALQRQILTDAGYDEPEPVDQVEQEERKKRLKLAGERIRKLIGPKDGADDG